MLVFALALLVYLLTLAPDVTWAHDGSDGGDLIAAVMTGGVPHPPGYPTFLLLASPLARLPFGNPAWRLNVFSALCAASAAGLTTLTVARIVTDLGHDARTAHTAGVGAGWLLAFSPVLWSQAVIAEVYALGALFTALVMFLAIRRSNRPVLWGLTFGLAVGVSPLLSLTGLTAPIALGKRIRHWLWAGLGVLIGLTVFLVLPLRALSGAPINWGNATTLDGWWWLVTAQLYRGYVFAVPLGSLGVRLLAWASLTARQLTPVGALLGLGGLACLWRANPGLARATLAMFAGWSIFAIGYNTMDSYVYLIPAFVLMANWAGVGLAEGLGRLNLTSFKNLGPLVIVLPLIALLISWPAADLHADHTAVDFGRAIMAQAPNRAILITSEDAHTFTLWYHRYARQDRLDVSVVDRDLLGMSWYRVTAAREIGSRDMWTASDPLALLESSGRPICRVSVANLDCR